MVHFCEALAQEIRSAYDQDEIDIIIHESVTRFHQNKHQATIFYINMMAVLRASSSQSVLMQEQNNLKYAIEVFSKHQQRASELF